MYCDLVGPEVAGRARLGATECSLCHLALVPWPHFNHQVRQWVEPNLGALRHLQPRVGDHDARVLVVTTVKCLPAPQREVELPVGCVPTQDLSPSVCNKSEAGRQEPLPAAETSQESAKNPQA